MPEAGFSLLDALRMAYQELPGVGRPLMPRGRDIMNILEASPPVPIAPAGTMARLFNTLLGQFGGIPFNKLPPWLARRLPAEYQPSTWESINETLRKRRREYRRPASPIAGYEDAVTRGYVDPIQERMAMALSQDPLHPVEALRKDRVLRDMSDLERAAMTLAHSLMGGRKSNRGLISGEPRFIPVELYDLERLLQPKKLTELKKWAHEVIQEDIQKQASREYWSPEKWMGGGYPQADDELIKALLTPGRKEIKR